MKSVLLSSIAGGVLLSSMVLGVATHAQDEVSVSGNVAYVTDYRFRGVSVSDKNYAIQGGFDLAADSGVYVGTWASSISGGTELDLYGGYGFSLSDAISADVGAIYYTYPNFDGDIDYYEFYGSLGVALTDALGIGAGVAYVPSQDNSDDNTYLFATGDYAVSDTVSLSASVALEDGAFAADGKTDWSLGASYSGLLGVDLGVTYIGTDLEDDEGTVVFSLSKAL